MEGGLLLSIPVVRVSLGSARECIVGPSSPSEGPGRSCCALCAVMGLDVGDAEGVPAVRVGYWRTAALAAVLDAALEAEEPMVWKCVAACEVGFRDSRNCIYTSVWREFGLKRARRCDCDI